MAYNATIQLYLVFAAVVIIAAVVTHLIRRSRAVSSAVAWGLIGSAVGFLAAPPLGVLAGLIPDVMLQREYFTRPFIGCISPAACLFLFVTSTTGVLGGFGAGFWFGLRRRWTHPEKLAC